MPAGHDVPDPTKTEFQQYQETQAALTELVRLHDLRARVQMLEALICRIARELPPGACSEATRSSIDGVVVACNATSRVRST
jgi:hypothetical protein